MWAAATPKLLSTIHHWRFNYWCSPVTGPLCTLIIHHQLLPVSSLFSLTPVLFTNELPGCSQSIPPISATAYYSLRFPSDKTALYLSPTSRSIVGKDIKYWPWICVTVTMDYQGQLAPAGAKTFIQHIHFISISLQNFPITIADFIIVIIIMRFICIAFFKTSLTKCFPEKKE